MIIEQIINALRNSKPLSKNFKNSKDYQIAFNVWADTLYNFGQELSLNDSKFDNVGFALECNAKFG